MSKTRLVRETWAPRKRKKKPQWRSVGYIDEFTYWSGGVKYVAPGGEVWIGPSRSGKNVPWGWNAVGEVPE